MVTKKNAAFCLVLDAHDETPTEEMNLFLYRVASTCAPKPKDALQLLQETWTLEEISQMTESQHHRTCWNRLRYLPTGFKALDDCLRGGLRVGTISEIAGRAGVGKTQLAMQLCVMAARYHQGAVYMDTENKLSLTRLQEIAEQRAAQHHNNNCNNSQAQQQWPLINSNRTHISSNDKFQPSPVHPNDSSDWMRSQPSSPNVPYPTTLQVLDNVTVFSPSNMQELMSSLLEVEELVLARNQDDINDDRPALHPAHHHHSTVFPIRIVIIDSIAAPAQRGGKSAPERASALFQCAQRLKQMADQLQLAILVINQVSLEHVPHNHASIMDVSSSNSFKVKIKAALGTSWHHCVSTRIMMGEPHDQEPFGNNAITQPKQAPHYRDMEGSYHRKTSEKSRVATIVKSNLVGIQSTKYIVTGSGIVDADDKPVTKDITNN